MAVRDDRVGPGEVAVEPLFVGICGTDLQIVLRERPDRARILGHEGIVEVTACGAEWSELQQGGVYVVNPVHPGRQDQVLGHSYDGLLRRRAILSTEHVDPRQFIPAPPDLVDLRGALVEPLATAVYGRRLVEGVVRPDAVVIFGGGPAGLLHALLARASGCSHLTLVTTSRDRLRWAEERSILRPGEGVLSTPATGTQIRERLGDRADAAFICTPARSSLEAIGSAIACVRDGGCIDLVGGVPPGARSPAVGDVDLAAIRRANHSGVPAEGVATLAPVADGRRIWLTGHRGTSREHVLVAIALLRGRSTPFTAVVSHVASLEGASRALDAYRRDRRRRLVGGEWVKVIVDVGRPGSDVSPFVPAEGWPTPA